MKKLFIAIIWILFLVSCTKSEETLDIINPNAEYVYFYWKTCPHCLKVNEYFVKNNIYDKYKIEKIEVWDNKENKKNFDSVVNELWLDSNDVWVPFIYKKADKSYFMWDEDIINYFK